MTLPGHTPQNTTHTKKRCSTCSAWAQNSSWVSCKWFSCSYLLHWYKKLIPQLLRTLWGAHFNCALCMKEANKRQWGRHGFLQGDLQTSVQNLICKHERNTATAGRNQDIHSLQRSWTSKFVRAESTVFLAPAPVLFHSFNIWRWQST